MKLEKIKRSMLNLTLRQLNTYNDYENIVENLISHMLLCVSRSEIGKDESLAFKLSRASNEKSGFSFGYVQFDASNSAYARSILSKLGLTDSQVEMLRQKVSNYQLINETERLLRENKEMVFEESKNYIRNSFKKLMSFPDPFKERVTVELMFYLIDMDVQFNLTKNGMVSKWIRNSTPEYITVENFIVLKYNTKWGKSDLGKRDVARRANCVADYLKTIIE